MVMQSQPATVRRAASSEPTPRVSAGCYELIAAVAGKVCGKTFGRLRGWQRAVTAWQDRLSMTRYWRAKTNRHRGQVFAIADHKSIQPARSRRVYLHGAPLFGFRFLRRDRDALCADVVG